VKNGAVLAAIVVATAVLSTITTASAATSRCEGCKPMEFKEKAKQLGTGQHVIASFTTNEINGYEVSSINGDLVVQDATVPDELQVIFAEAREFFLHTDGTARAAIEVHIDELGVPGGNGATAADVAWNANLRAMVGDRLVKPLPGTDAVVNRALAGISTGAYSYVGLSDGTIRITVGTADGRVGYEVAAQSLSAKYLSD
jgi:hypothetical protein